MPPTADAVDGAATELAEAADATEAATDEAVDETAAAADATEDAVEEETAELAEGATDENVTVTTSTVPIQPVAEAPDDIAPLLTPGTFDADPILAYIDASELEDVQKAELRTTVEAAGEDPEQVDSAIDVLKTTFEIE